MNWLLNAVLNVTLDILFGKQEQIERRTAPRSCHCWHETPTLVLHHTTCPLYAGIGHAPGGDHEYVTWTTDD